jgi:hypothetical protein
MPARGMFLHHTRVFRARHGESYQAFRLEFSLERSGPERITIERDATNNLDHLRSENETTPEFKMPQRLSGGAPPRREAFGKELDAALSDEEPEYQFFAPDGRSQA